MCLIQYSFDLENYAIFLVIKAVLDKSSRIYMIVSHLIIFNRDCFATYKIIGIFRLWHYLLMSPTHYCLITIVIIIATLYHSTGSYKYINIFSLFCDNQFFFFSFFLFFFFSFFNANFPFVP